MCSRWPKKTNLCAWHNGIIPQACFPCQRCKRGAAKKKRQDKKIKGEVEREPEIRALVVVFQPSHQTSKSYCFSLCFSASNLRLLGVSFVWSAENISFSLLAPLARTHTSFPPVLPPPHPCPGLFDPFRGKLCTSWACSTPGRAVSPAFIAPPLGTENALKLPARVLIATLLERKSKLLLMPFGAWRARNCSGLEKTHRKHPGS